MGASYVNVGGTWKAAQPWIRKSGVWKPAKPWLRQSGAWENAFLLQPTVTFLNSHTATAADQSTVSFSWDAASLGAIPASGHRLIIAAVFSQQNGAADPVSVSVGGVGLTRVTGIDGAAIPSGFTDLLLLSLWYGEVNSGLTGTVRLTTTSPMESASVDLYHAVNHTQIAPVSAATAQKSSGASNQVTLTPLSLGLGVASVTNIFTTDTGDPTWGAATKGASGSTISPFGIHTRISSAFASNLPAGQAWHPSASQAGANNYGTIAAAVWI